MLPGQDLGPLTTGQSRPVQRARFGVSAPGWSQLQLSSAQPKLEMPPFQVTSTAAPASNQRPAAGLQGQWCCQRLPERCWVCWNELDVLGVAGHGQLSPSLLALVFLIITNNHTPRGIVSSASGHQLGKFPPSPLLKPSKSPIPLLTHFPTLIPHGATWQTTEVNCVACLPFR
ncbi:hypothetical protein FALBO_14886 [Fusarium albosuccineum]|uniref:Uncharacterized protein n=1 Tax=Fusarium albosuccineum TaxID=1237068 RepID=A0A8H4KYE3_9HYPO|nr:hypothetical protein FALBO_14886 [Fusarium albosuccineum]